MSYKGSVAHCGDIGGMSAYVYYNADIISNRASDLTSGLAVPAPPIRFNETRDAPIVGDASQYLFSIIRFTMNGSGLEIPLFIPDIVEFQPIGTPNAQNITSYKVAITLQQTWNTNVGPVTFNLAPPPTVVIWEPQYKNPIIAPTPSLPTGPNGRQDLSSRYYWATTYDHFVTLINRAFIQAHISLYVAFINAWASTPGLTDPFPYVSFTDWATSADGFVSPYMTWGQTTNLFNLYADTRAFGTPLTNFVPPPIVPGTATPATAPSARLFFNTNLFNLFANFPNYYWNSTSIPGFPATLAPGYVYEILFTNKFFSNVANYVGSTSVPTDFQHTYWVNSQDYDSVSEIWSPVSSIVFTSTLLPIKAEQTGQPVVLGENNLGDSQPTSQAAFQPIITDIALPLGDKGASAYREFLYYTPSAEYRLTAMTPSKIDIRNIDIQVFWKHRLTNELYPLQIPNQGSVSIKCMFRHLLA